MIFSFLKYKRLTKGSFKRKSGRNFFGRITVSHRGGGFKKKFRSIQYFNLSKHFLKFFYFFNFSYFSSFIFFKKLTIEKDPFRSENINLCQNLNWGFLTYKKVLPSFSNLFKEPSFYFNKFSFKNAFTQNLFFNSSFLFTLPLGSCLKNIEQFPLSGPIFGNAFGSFCFLRRQFANYSLIEFPSKKFVILSSANLCTPCSESQTNMLYSFTEFSKKKAGFSRWLGIKPTVKGRAKNPIDHPNGGRTGPGGISRNPWGFLAKGPKTVSSLKKKKTMMKLQFLLKNNVI